MSFKRITDLSTKYSMKGMPGFNPYMSLQSVRGFHTRVPMTTRHMGVVNPLFRVPCHRFYTQKAEGAAQFAYDSPYHRVEPGDGKNARGDYITHPSEKPVDISDGMFTHRFHFIPGVIDHYHKHLPLITVSNPEARKMREKEKKYSRDEITSLETLPTDIVRTPKTIGDKLALNFMRFLRIFTHAFFREKYNHHAVTLETIASIPPTVAAALRHFESLRNIKHDHGWVHMLMEEAENERVHLFTWMEVTNPTFLERLLVIAAQIGYTTFYTCAYIVNPAWCHRLTGYLEEEATSAYTAYLEAIDKGKLPNGPAPDIAKKYWHLADNATIRDVVLCVRADEMHHRDFNHQVADKIRNNDLAGVTDIKIKAGL